MVVAVREAATVLLVEDRQTQGQESALHVFMQRRSEQAVFSPGALVFPGGAVDDADADPAVYERAAGITDSEASALLAVPRNGLRYWIAALREAFEESGLLLADTAVDPERLAADRVALNANQTTFRAVLERHDVMLRAGEVHVFSHWLTPEGAPRRFDTWFFVAPAPAGQHGWHDDYEAIASEWIQPSAMLSRFADGLADLIFPTMRTLQAIEAIPATAELLGATHAAMGERQRPPLVISDGSGERIALTAAERADAGRGWLSLATRARDPGSYQRETDRLIAKRRSSAPCPT